jgi:hypothetical protein
MEEDEQRSRHANKDRVAEARATRSNTTTQSHDAFDKRELWEQYEDDLETLESPRIFDLDDIDRMFSQIEEACSH